MQDQGFVNKKKLLSEESVQAQKQMNVNVFPLTPLTVTSNHIVQPRVYNLCFLILLMSLFLWVIGQFLSFCQHSDESYCN